MMEEDKMKTKQSGRTLVLAGIGSGNVSTLTLQCSAAIFTADVIFGSGRVLALVKQNIFERTAEKNSSGSSDETGEQHLPKFEEMYEGDPIFAFLEGHPELRHPVALLSGDTGFFSGAAGILKAFSGKDGWDVKVFPGISSASLLAAKLGISWQDARMISTHGRDMDEVNPLGWIRENPKVFILVSGPEDVRRIGKMLSPDAGKLRFAFGTNLGMKGEAFGFCTAPELAAFDRQGLTLLSIENPEAERRILTPGIPDSEWIRCTGGEDGSRRPVPMTKEEVRVISLSRLRLTPRAVLWDIGAGCGSVSVEAARLAPGIRVYAVEMRDDAAAVIRANAEKFGADNVHSVHAKAPEGLDNLPAPTHVFIGGSSGNLREILSYIKKRSPKARIVINTVTLETQAEALSALKALSFTEPEVRVISAARAETAGHFHLMKAMNPVTIIDCEGV